jgi:hypothetical protein
VRLLQIDKNVEREILNHRMLNNINVIAFKEVSPGQHSMPHHMYTASADRASNTFCIFWGAAWFTSSCCRT